MNNPEFFGRFFKRFEGSVNTLSSIVVYHFYRKNKETINEADRKESSKSHGEFVRKAITFLCGYLSLCLVVTSLCLRFLQSLPLEMQP